MARTSGIDWCPLQLAEINAFFRNSTFVKSLLFKMALKNHSHRSPLFMEDGAPGHRAASTKTWHAKNGINLLPDWPGNSPDLNPIENLWSEMKNRLRDERPTSKAGIKKVCQKVWKNIGVDYLEKLYESMPRRIQAVIDAEGGHTKY